KTRSRKTLDNETLDLRSPHQQTFHAEGKSVEAQRPRRLRRLLQSEEPTRTKTSRPLSVLQLRRPTQARQTQSRHLLAERRITRRQRQSPRSEEHTSELQS